jgi:uncharacterized short protein YbdD (DUF466 family)
MKAIERSSLARLWRAVRQISGDDAYERYTEHRARCHPGEPMLDRRAFYLAEQQRKWSGMQRCC